MSLEEENHNLQMESQLLGLAKSISRQQADP